MNTSDYIKGLSLELDRLTEYYGRLSVERTEVDSEMAHYYRGAANAINLLASWIERKNARDSL